MRNLAKYFLALAVMGSGFYAAQQHRLPNGKVPGGTVAVREPAAESPSSGGQRLPGANSPTALPVAALADVDRVPLLGPDRPKTLGRSTLPDTGSVTKQPTLRGEGQPEPSPSAETAKESGSDATNVDSKKQAEVKPKPKKQNAKKAAKTEDEDKDREKDKDFVPPELAHEYRPLAEALDVGKQANSAGHGELDPQKAARSASTSSAAAEPQKASSAGAPRRHRIAEGDTLARLAEKYLGSRDRYLDLFQANADVLFDPRLIPIGVELVIPDRTTVVAQAATTPATVDQANDNPTPPSDSTPDSQ
jgi:nucleoid-associated protein YgaU